jgi:decaprenylphospho-beta-D-erythro-pentofuranosid-2-ulose 2-reductase
MIGKPSQSKPPQALIIAATSDIGKWIAKGLARRGFSLILTGRTDPELQSLKKSLESEFRVSVETRILDLMQYQTHTSFYHSLTQKPDIVFCCAGYYQDQKKAREDFREAYQTIGVNFTGVVSVINIISNDFEDRGYGGIVVLSSVAGERGRQLNYLYGSTKAGLTAYLSGLRNRLFKRGVSITTIQLGPVYTRMSAGHNLMPFLTLKPESAAEKIIRAGLSKKGQVHIFWPWKLIMLIIKLIPEWMFKRLPPF